MVGFKRVYNITKSLNGTGRSHPALFEHEEERDLHELIGRQEGCIILKHMEARRYAEAIGVLVGFKETIDRYFDKVFVMVDDERVRITGSRYSRGSKTCFSSSATSPRSAWKSYPNI